MRRHGPRPSSALTTPASPKPANGKPGPRARLGDPVRRLPERVWKPPRHEDDEAAEEGIGRILALSDGVFAIGITLLIIQIAVLATASDAALPKDLLGLWPRYLAYLLSFLVIARFWVIHHQVFRLIARYDMALIWLNLLLLMFVAFLPFPTAVVGQHASSPAAAVLYAASAGLAATASAAYWWYASGRGRLLRPGVQRAHARALRARSVTGPVFFALTLPIAVFAPYAAEALWIFAFPWPGWHSSGSPPRNTHRPDKP
jgi:uncharacterized membrane protein